MINSISFEKFFINKYSKKKNKFSNFKYILNLIDEIERNINIKKDIFYTFSKNYNYEFKTKDFDKFQKFKKVVIIGMGGSILGSKAVYNFLQHKIKKEFLFLDNLEETNILKLKNFSSKNKTLYVAISKSGNTAETLVNLSFAKKNILNSKNTILISEYGQNTFKNISNKFKIPIIEHKPYIGGRYAIFSEAIIIPMILMGLNIKNFKKNILKNFSKSKKISLGKNVSYLSRVYLSKKINNFILFNYSPYLNNFMFWFQQLIAESLGKKGDGILPVVSLAPKDHHSLLQLYLDGPKDKLFYIFSSRNILNNKVGDLVFSKKNKFFVNKSTHKIVNSQKKAFISILKKKKIPFKEFYLRSIDEQTIGELFSYFILETVLIANVLGKNAFDQPAVEEVKKLTKKFLTR